MVIGRPPVRSKAFEFATSTRIVFGRGRSVDIGSLAQELAGQGGGTRALLLTGSVSADMTGVTEAITERLEASGFTVTHSSCSGEPTVSSVNRTVEAALVSSPCVMVAAGGGSVLDTAKAVGALITNGGKVDEYLEGVGTRVIDRPSLPLVAMPTTAGTGSEVTKNAVITADDGSYKKSMRSPHLLPRIALVDSTLTHSVPPQISAYTGLDALTQLIEAYTSLGANAMTDALAESGIQLVARSLRQVCVVGDDEGAREDMSLAALLGGICLANAGLGAVHGLVAPLGARFPVPHGAGCAALLPHVIEANIGSIRRATPTNPVLGKYKTVAQILAPRSEQPTREPARALRELIADLGVPGLASWGVRQDGLSTVVERSRGGSMRFNPVELNDDELGVILEAAM